MLDDDEFDANDESGDDDDRAGGECDDIAGDDDVTTDIGPSRESRSSETVFETCSVEPKGTGSFGSPSLRIWARLFPALGETEAPSNPSGDV